MTNYPGESVEAKPVDDIARCGRDATMAPFRQNIGGNQISMADPASYPYNATTRADFEATNVFETCKTSSDNTCKWDRCCIQWTWKAKVVAGAVTVNTVTVDRKWCDKGF